MLPGVKFRQNLEFSCTHMLCFAVIHHCVQQISMLLLYPYLKLLTRLPDIINPSVLLNRLAVWLQKITGSKMERCCDLCHITLNKNAVVGDVSAMTPGGVRIGAPAMTSRGLKEADFEQIAEFLHEAMELCKDLQNKHGRLLKDFNKWGTQCLAWSSMLLAESCMVLCYAHKLLAMLH